MLCPPDVFRFEFIDCFKQQNRTRYQLILDQEVRHTFTSKSVAPKSDHLRVQVRRMRTQSTAGLAASCAQRSARPLASSSALADPLR